MESIEISTVKTPTGQTKRLLRGDDEGRLEVKVGIDQTTPGTTDSVTVKAGGGGSTVVFSRPADTNAYAANDVIGTATGSTAALTFSNIGVAGKPIVITDVNLRINNTSLPSGMAGFRLHLYSATPSSALGDNAAFDLPSGDRAAYKGYIDITTPTDLGSTLYSQNVQVNKGVLLASPDLSGYLTTLGAYPPDSATEYFLELVCTGGL